jgi:hypothetical protein
MHIYQNLHLLSTLKNAFDPSLGLNDFFPSGDVVLEKNVSGSFKPAVIEIKYLNQ